MKNTLNKLWGLLVILVIFFIPFMVKANTTDSYLVYENIISGGEEVNGWSGGGDEAYFYMRDEVEYSFALKGYNLEEDVTYVLKLSSDFMSFSDEYTGKELMDGITISRNDGDGTMLSEVYLKSNGEKIKAKFTGGEVYFFNKVYFRFNDNFDSTEIDAYFKKIAPNGVIELNTIALKDLTFMETSIASALSKYNTEKFWVYGYCDDEYENCEMYISDTTKNWSSKRFDVEYIFQEADEEILKKVNEYLKKFGVEDFGLVEENLFILDDLENINYKYAIIKHGGEDMTTINSVINYSSEVMSILDYGNFTAILDTRAGWGEEFTAGGFGFFNLLYNGVIYGAADGVGVKQVNTLYVPDDTKDTREDYIKAALKRVEEYLPNAKVELTYAGQINDIEFESDIVSVEDLIDINKTLGEYYTLTIDGNSYSFFIVKDSSKMKNPEMNTVDLKTNIKINSDSYEVPLDARVNVGVLDRNSKEYKDLMSKLNLDTGMSVDLNLYSGLTDTYVTKLENGKFKVYVPLTKEYLNRDLKAYYIKDDGSIEIHEVKVENGYAVFETDHFSTYTIGGSLLANPDTFDGISAYFILAVVSLVGALFATYKFKSLEK